MIWTIQEFVDRKRQRNRMEGFAVVAIAISTMAVDAYFRFHKAAPANPPTVTVGWIGTSSSVEAPRGFTVPDAVLVSNGRTFELLGKAVAKWSQETGSTVRQPPLYRLQVPGNLGSREGGYFACSDPSALACYNRKEKKMLIPSTTEQRADLFSILLHEVGHSMGVPHIEDDPLMQAEARVLDFTIRPIPPMALAIGKCKVNKTCP